MAQTFRGAGIAAIVVFLLSVAAIATLQGDFDPLRDVVSKLGAAGRPYGGLFNAVGFGVTGLLLAVFGISFGVSIGDRLVAVLLGLFGVAFTAIAAPAILDQPDTLATRIHIAIVCLCMGVWCISLARTVGRRDLSGPVRIVSYAAIVPVMLAVFGAAFDAVSPAVFQRLFFGGIFAWVLGVSLVPARPPTL